MSQEICTIPPKGWHCTRKPGHDCPCAAEPDDDLPREMLIARIKKLEEDCSYWVKNCTLGGAPMIIDGDHKVCTADPDKPHEIYGSAMGLPDGTFQCYDHGYQKMVEVLHNEVQEARGIIERYQVLAPNLPKNKVLAQAFLDRTATKENN